MIVPIRLGMLGGATPRRASAADDRAAAPRAARRFFPDPSFVEAVVAGIDGDGGHVRLIVGDEARRCAVGHLPRALVERMTPGARMGVEFADHVRRHSLGIDEHHVIEDVRDDRAAVCALALAVLRRHGGDPDATLRQYAECATLLREIIGGDDGNGREITLRGRRGLLTVARTFEDWSLEDDEIIVRRVVPRALAAAAAGRPLADLVEHPLLDGLDAVIVAVTPGTAATAIRFETRPTKVSEITRKMGGEEA